MKENILIVCWGNIQRSPTAAYILNKKLESYNLDTKYEATSRGIQGSGKIKKPRFVQFSGYVEEYAAALPILKKYNINLDSHVSTPISESDVENAKIVLAMDRRVLNDPEGGLLQQFPHYKEKIYLFTSLIGQEEDIQDPITIKDKEKYEEIIGEIDAVIEQGFPRLRSLL